jgi:hypothetical protein
MRQRSDLRSIPVHWSKDFVEHLRTVHFALLTVSTGLIILLTSKSYDAKKAAGQMTTIMQIKGLSNLQRGVGSLSTRRAAETSVDYSPWFTARSSRGTLPFHVVEPNLFVCGYKLGTESYPGFMHLDPSRMPNTLFSFAHWWNDLGRSEGALISVTRIGREGVLQDYITGKSEKITVTKTGAQAGNPVELVLSGVCQLPHSFREKLQLSGEKDELGVSFPVENHAVNRWSQQIFSIRFGAQIGSYAQSFPDLAEEAKGREDLELATLAPQIYAEAAKNDEIFDALGVKLQSKEITRWGMLVLIGLELYLVMYLRRLSHRLGRDDPGWDVPWMALDQSPLARGMLFFSMVLAPISASALIVYETASRLITRGLTWRISLIIEVLTVSELVRLITAVFLFCVSAGLSILCWAYRPKLNEPVGNIQAFE